MKRTKAKTASWGQPKSAFFNFEQIERYYTYQEAGSAHDLLSDRTMQDLDMEEFFKFIDRTHSIVGQQYLYNCLRQLGKAEAPLEELEQGAQYFHQNENERLATKKALNRLSNKDDYHLPFLIYGKLPPKIKYLWLIYSLRWVAPLSIVFLLFYPYFLLPLILFMLINTFLHYWHKKRIGSFAAVFLRLTLLNETAKAILPHSQYGETERQGIKQSIGKVKKTTSKFLSLEAHLLQDNEFAVAVWAMAEFIKIIWLQEITTFHNVVDEIESNREDIHQLFRFIGKTDMALSVASLRAGLPYYSKPQFTSKRKEIQLKGLYHPLVENCVANDLHLNNKSLLLTGSNMSGKSTFIKAINLNIIASQVLNTSFSQHYEAPIFALATSIQIRDALMEGKSYYMEEVSTIGDLLSASEESEHQYLFTIDEVFKGTNTVERVSSAKAILEYLNRSHHLVLVSTHDIELTQLLKEGFDLYYFQESIEDKNLSFDYKLRRGALKRRNAINILEMAGYPSGIIEEAKRLASQFENEKMGVQPMG